MQLERKRAQGITFEQPWGTGHDRGEFTEAAGRTEPHREEAQQGESKRQDLLIEAAACNPPKCPHGNLSHILISITAFRKSEGAFQLPTYSF